MQLCGDRSSLVMKFINTFLSGSIRITHPLIAHASKISSLSLFQGRGGELVPRAHRLWFRVYCEHQVKPRPVPSYRRTASQRCGCADKRKTLTHTGRSTGNDQRRAGCSARAGPGVIRTSDNWFVAPGRDRPLGR